MKTVRLMVIALLLSGCDGGGTGDRREETVGADVASGYNQQIQRAQNVQLELETGKRDLDDAIEASDQGRRDP